MATTSDILKQLGRVDDTRPDAKALKKPSTPEQAEERSSPDLAEAIKACLQPTQGHKKKIS